MLLGSPPDMVRRVPLRETGSAAARGGLLLTLILYYILCELATKILHSRKNASHILLKHTPQSLLQKDCIFPRSIVESFIREPPTTRIRLPERTEQKGVQV